MRSRESLQTCLKCAFPDYSPPKLLKEHNPDLLHNTTPILGVAEPMVSEIYANEVQISPEFRMRSIYKAPRLPGRTLCSSLSCSATFPRASARESGIQAVPQIQFPFCTCRNIIRNLKGPMKLRTTHLETGTKNPWMMSCLLPCPQNPSSLGKVSYALNR